jgi:hypothetical protein
LFVLLAVWTLVQILSERSEARILGWIGSLPAFSFAICSNRKKSLHLIVHLQLLDQWWEWTIKKLQSQNVIAKLQFNSASQGISNHVSWIVITIHGKKFEVPWHVHTWHPFLPTFLCKKPETQNMDPLGASFLMFKVAWPLITRDCGYEYVRWAMASKDCCFPPSIIRTWKLI